MRPRTVLVVLAAVLALACSWSSQIIVANTAWRDISITVHYQRDLARLRVLPIDFAAVDAIADERAWHPAPERVVAVDTNANAVHLTLPPRTAVRLGEAYNCDSPTACPDDSFPLLSLALSGRNGALSATGEQLRVSFTRENRYRWVLWYPWTGTHGFGENLLPTNAGMLCLALAVAAFTLWAAALVARTPMPARWRWTFVALLGFGQLTINWTTGETGIELFAWQLLGASMEHRGPLGPWVLGVSFPLGALLALHRRRRAIAILRAQPDCAASEPTALQQPTALDHTEPTSRDL